MNEAPPPVAELLRRTFEEIGERVPSGWKVSFELEPSRRTRGGTERPDAVMRVEGPGGRRATIVVEARGDGAPRSVIQALRQLRPWTGKGERLLVAPFLPERSRAMATAEGVHYADLTGNIRLSLRRPALFVRDRGEDRNPFRVKGPARGLSGSAAARVVLGLCRTVPPPSGLMLGDLARGSGVSLSYVSRVVGVLEREALVRRRPRGPIEAVDLPGLVRRWAEDYSLLGSNRGAFYLDPRGAKNALRNMKGKEFRRRRFAVTGSFAAERFAPVSVATRLVCFVDDPGAAADALGLAPARSGGNVLLLAPYDPVVYEESGDLEPGSEGASIPFAPVAQVAVDCLTGPDRMPEEGEALLRWLAENRSEWEGLRPGGDG